MTVTSRSAHEYMWIFTTFYQRVGHEVPGVVVWPLLLHVYCEMLGDISYDNATLQSRVNKVFTSLHQLKAIIFTSNKKV